MNSHLAYIFTKKLYDLQVYVTRGHKELFITKPYDLQVYVTRGHKELFITKPYDLQVYVTRGHIIFPMPALVDLRMLYVVSAT